VSNLVDINGRQLNRPQKREIEREITKKIGDIIPRLINDIQVLAFRSDATIEILKILGVTEEQFQRAVDKVEERRKQQTKEVD